MSGPPDACAEPHQGCGCERDASQGAHEGPCEFEGGYGDDGSQVVCIHCAAAIWESKRTACPDCEGAGMVAVAELQPTRGRRRAESVQVTGAKQEPCFSCLGSGRRATV
jgi:hypothetical protein